MNNLDSEINHIEIHNFINQTEKAIKKELKEGFKNACMIILPAIISISGILITKNVNFVFLFVATNSAVIIRKIIKDLKEEQKILKNISKKDDELTIEDVLEKGIDKRNSKNFYNEEYNRDVEEYNNRSITQRKIEKVLEKQRINREEIISNKEEVMEDILNKIDTLYYAYNLPKLTITNEEWIQLFDKLYESVINNKGDINEYYNVMLKLVRCTFSKALLDDAKEINFDSLVKGLEYAYTKEALTSKNINEIKRDNNSKIVNLDEYKKRIKK